MTNEIKVCAKCKETKPATNEFFSWLNSEKGFLHPYCKVCRNIYLKMWRDSSPEKRRASARRYYAKNPERMIANTQVFYNKLKQEVIDMYGGQCTCCRETRIPFLTLEHTRGDGKAHRKRVGSGSSIYRDLKNRGWPQNEGLTILCMNCNLATKHGRVCPHTLEQSFDTVKEAESILGEI